jgi:hypothetical protein
MKDVATQMSPDESVSSFPDDTILKLAHKQLHGLFATARQPTSKIHMFYSIQCNSEFRHYGGL